MKLYRHAAEIDRALRRLPYVWASALADRIAPQLAADAKSAETAADRAREYSRQVQEGIISAIQFRLLHDPGCAQNTLDRIATVGSSNYGLRREPDIETVRAAVDVARQRNPRGAPPAFSVRPYVTALSSFHAST